MTAEMLVYCAKCNKEGVFEKLVGWAVEMKNNQATAFFCSDCKEGLDVNPESIELKFVPFETKLPILGNFKPVKSKKEFESVRGTYMNTEHWSEFEDQIGQAIASKKPVLERIHVENHQDIPALYIYIVRDSERVVQIDFAGDTPGKGLDLDIYQKHRLAEMGLTVSGEKDKTWSLIVSEPEAEPTNLARVISHVLEFGYFVKHHKIISLNMTVN